MAGDGKILNLSSKTLWVVETDSGPAIAHLLAPNWRSPTDVDADGVRAKDFGVTISGHDSWWKFRLVEVEVADDGPNLAIRRCIYPACYDVGPGEFGDVTYDSRPGWGQQITVREREEAERKQCRNAATLVERHSGRLLTADNVDTDADDQTRVQQLLALVSTAVGALGDTGNVENKKRFMLHLAWHEGAKIMARVQGGGGPARSFYQLEREKAIDAVDYASTQGWLGLLAGAAGMGGNTQPLIDAFNELNQEPSNPRFPAGNLIEDKLRTVDLFGTYMARIALKRASASIGTSNQEHANYWATYWKVNFDSDAQRAALIATFKQEADYVDTLI